MQLMRRVVLTHLGAAGTLAALSAHASPWNDCRRCYQNMPLGLLWTLELGEARRNRKCRSHRGGDVLDRREEMLQSAPIWFFMRSSAPRLRLHRSRRVSDPRSGHLSRASASARRGVSARFGVSHIARPRPSYAAPDRLRVELLDNHGTRRSRVAPSLVQIPTADLPSSWYRFTIIILCTSTASFMGVFVMSVNTNSEEGNSR